MNMENRGAQMLSLLEALVRCPTENHPPRGNEAPGQAVLRAAYEAMGLETRMLCPADLPEYPAHPAFLPRDFAGRENLVGTWRGEGGGRSVLLTGHMDVVPKEPMPWTVTQPFEPLIQAGRMYGRGTADMKAGLVCAAEAVRRLQEEGFRPKGDVILESVVDEEYAGANGTVAGRLAGINADFGIVLEASGAERLPRLRGRAGRHAARAGRGGHAIYRRGNRQPGRRHRGTDLADSAVQRKAHGRGPQAKLGSARCRGRRWSSPR